MIEDPATVLMICLAAFAVLVATIGPPDWRQIWWGLCWPVHVYRWLRKRRHARRT